MNMRGTAQSTSINGMVAPDSYTTLSTIEGDNYARFLIDVNNQSIYWQLKRHSGGPRGSGDWDSTETQMSPGSRVISRSDAVGIRFRARVPAASIPGYTT